MKYLTLLAVLLTACNDINAPAPVDLTGVWELTMDVKGFAGACERTTALQLHDETGERGSLQPCSFVIPAVNVPVRATIAGWTVTIIDTECRFDGQLVADNVMRGTVACNHFDKPSGTWMARRIP